MHQIGPHVATTGLRLVLLLTCAFSQADDRAHSVASIVADGRVNMTKDELIDHYRERYPLIYAAGEADHSTLKALIAQGADVNVRSADGETALHLNAIKGDSFTTKLLLAAGAEVDARTPEAPTRKHKGPMRWQRARGRDGWHAYITYTPANGVISDQTQKRREERRSSE